MGAIQSKDPNRIARLSFKALIYEYIFTGHIFFNKRWRKPKGQSNIDNPETLATLGTPDKGRRQKKLKHTSQHRKKTLAMLLI